MVKVTKVLQTSNFKRTVKKLHQNQKQDLDKAIKMLMENPQIGEQKKGDLCFLRVYKFKMVKRLTLLGYSYEDGAVILELITVGTRKNFYREAKKVL